MGVVQQADLGLDAPNRLSAPLASLLGGLDAGWQPVVDGWRESAAGQGLLAHVAARQDQGVVIYPADPLRALRLTPLADTRVVILGQDPYHGPGQAEGLAFSVPAGLKLPPSLRNIFKELQRDLGQPMPASGHLLAWAQRGVLLLNTCLTVEDGQAASHAKRGWEALTDGLIAAAAADAAPKVFMLWGAHAQSKLGLIAASGGAHLVLQCNHPSPLSATRGPVPFVCCGHFSQAAAFVAAQGGTLAWSL
ncbi:MAG: uracil-DNA glycosylase [Burkholderiaceae bacterium]|nr:uracil-DNA glycosylase [Burkholderiaceae bacterium]